MLPTEAEVISELNAECPGFKCSPDKMSRCCCRRFLYNQPDFTNVKSHLETVCEERGFRVIFLPKFHCELSFIEMCCHSKVQTRTLILVLIYHRFSIRSRRFIDAYRKGLNGEQAAWAIKKYRGHRVLPEHIMHNFDISLTQNTSAS
ncbi:hypothetical protein K503DRAFT_794945 [Rhizopogon vinicolor AM-OR11-026]|uniref:Uncharacterized protein n=1 Tax=Rhizopogon vinicolor AM-OR11-026 TaxID=1314800 RepID=A0A1B7MFU5_9AGAM|nr:hypothetical protein K503DRAFT_794945 [Rhizopogon vinicolor AM-OR11-026]